MDIHLHLQNRKVMLCFSPELVYGGMTMSYQSSQISPNYSAVLENQPHIYLHKFLRLGKTKQVWSWYFCNTTFVTQGRQCQIFSYIILNDWACARQVQTEHRWTLNGLSSRVSSLITKLTSNSLVGVAKPLTNWETKYLAFSCTEMTVGLNRDAPL